MTSADKHLRDPRVVRTRAALRAALIALLSEHGLGSITVQMIAGRAGVGYATFFRHYAGVGALLADLADATIADFIAATLPIIAAGDRQRTMRALVDYVVAHRVTVHALLIGGGDAVRRDVVARAVAHTSLLPGLFAPDVPGDLATIHAVTSAIDVIGWWLDGDAARDPEQVAALLYRLALEPVVADRR